MSTKPLDLWPVYEMRPPNDYFRGGTVLRYDGGRWAEDDGEHDLAFLGRDNRGFPICLFVELPFQRNIVLSWLTTDWRGTVPSHPRGGNPWHYQLRAGAKDWGGPWGRDDHPNSIAGQSGMNKCCSLYRCANGRSAEMRIGDPFVSSGLVREKKTGKVLAFPHDPVCMYCGGGWTEAA